MRRHAEAPESLFSRLEPLLAEVARPVQYVGGEANAVVKPWSQAAVRWCLMYPDAYEVGQPNQGLAVLYELLNEQEDILAERSFAVWPDLARLLRQHGLPQFSLESHRPVKAYDFLGVSLGSELGYTNFLEALDLAGIPLQAASRTDDDPFVVVGGHVAANPEPIADYIDVAVLGDGEKAVLDLSRAFADWQAAGRPDGRTGLLDVLARTGQMYVPQFYDVSYLGDGRIASVTPNRPSAPPRVHKYTLSNLDAWAYPARPLVPLAETVHERYSVEIFRGCTRGCRFCQAGMITRPVRERSLDVIGQMAEQGLAATGYEEVGLLSLSSADHSEIGPLTRSLADRFDSTNVSLSLPSTRVDAFNIDLAGELSRNGRRSGLTFAPEGGSERLRRVINKNVSEDDLIATVKAAFQAGWRQIKLYFMCGLPTESDDDVLAIADLAFRVIETGRQETGRRDIGCTVSIGGFVPKPHTPFQWAPQASADQVNRRLRLLKEAVRQDKRCGQAVKVRYHDGRPGLVEGLLARGDRRVGRVVEAVWRSGGRFDGWSEHFSFERWTACAEAELAGQGLSLDWYTVRQRDRSEVLPWDHLDVGLDRDWLWDDWQDAAAEVEVPDCRWEGCSDCGVCPGLGTCVEIGPSGRPLAPPRLPLVSAKSGVAVRSAGGPAGEGKDAASLAAGESAPAARPDPAGGRTRQEAPKPRAQPPQQPPPVQRLVLRYAKRGRARFASHRDFARAFERALRRAFLPMAYSSGFNPHPRISWANPAPTGAESEAEYVEIGLADRISPAVAAAALNQVLPAGFAVLAAVPSPGGAWTTPLTASEWEIGLGPVPTAALASALGRFLAAAEARVSRLTKNGERVFDARAAVAAATLGAGPGEAISSALPPAAGRAEEPSPDQSGGDGFSVLRPAGFGKEDADRPFWQSQDEAETRSAQGRRRGGESAASSSLWLALRHSEPLVRPDDVVTALRLLEPALAVGPPARLRRLVQGPLGAGGRVEDPFGA